MCIKPELCTFHLAKACLPHAELTAEGHSFFNLSSAALHVD